ncbi:MAG: thioredoxin family protein [Chloroflexota bacterium]
MACIAAKPVVDSIETNTKDKANVIRLNIQSDVGQMYASRFNARTVPTFVMLNAQGEVAWTMVGRVEPQKVYDSLK